MRTLPKPTDTASGVFALCISKIRNRDLKARLSAIEGNIANAATEYDKAATSVELHTFPRSGNIGVVTKEEMIALYVGRMVPQTQPGRAAYDRLMSVPQYQTCPLCGVGTVKTLDHHLPKAEYTNLAVTPTNLIPSCHWCQTSKRQNYPKTAEEQTLHPYYDDFTDAIWLRANVIEDTPAAFFFFADPPPDWDIAKRDRVRHHMSSFDLAKLFASNAGNHLLGMRRGLNDLFNAGGEAAVRVHLTEAADSKQAAFRNSWETAMYRAGASSDWFCDGGFALQ